MTKIFILSAALLLISFFASAQRKISAGEAAGYYGETVTICDKIYGIEFSESSKSFTAIKVGDAAKKSKMFVFLTPELLYDLTGNGKTSLINKSVCVTGKVRKLNGFAEIIVEKSEEIYLHNEVTGGSQIRPNDFMRFE